MKICSFCNIEKEDDEFHRRQSKCKPCQSKYAKEWRKNNKKELKLKKQLYYQENKEKISIKNKKYNADPKNKRKRKQRDKDNHLKISQWSKKYRSKNREKINAAKRKYQSKQRKKPRYRLDHNFSKQILDAIKGLKNGQKWENIVGYSLEDLISHIEKQFDENMSWENYGSYWQIDHIIPKCMFKYKSTDDEEFQLCWCLNNLQPLEKTRNNFKNGRFIG